MSFKPAFLGLFLFLAACGGKAGQAGLEKLSQGDRVGALREFEAARAKSPEDRQVHFQLFVLYRYFQDQGEPAKSEAYQKSAFDEYIWISKADGVQTDYKDMEGSLKASAPSQAEFQAAYATVYGR